MTIKVDVRAFKGFREVKRAATVRLDQAKLRLGPLDSEFCPALFLPFARFRVLLVHPFLGFLCSHDGQALQIREEDRV